MSLAEHLQERGHLDSSWRLTDSGGDLLATWGLEKPLRSRGEACMDSTERRFHLAGPLGTAICRIFFSRGWLERLGATRAVRLTPAGGAILRDAGLDPGEYGSAL